MIVERTFLGWSCVWVGWGYGLQRVWEMFTVSTRIRRLAPRTAANDCTPVESSLDLFEIGQLKRVRPARHYK